MAAPISTTLKVLGMTCEHCVRSVRDELSRIEGVQEVDVDLATGTVVVASTAPLDDVAVRAAVDEAGYEVAAT